MENVVFGLSADHFVPLMIHIIRLCSDRYPGPKTAGLGLVHTHTSFQDYSMVTDEDINIQVESTVRRQPDTTLHPAPPSAQQRGESLSRRKPPHLSAIH